MGINIGAGATQADLFDGKALLVRGCRSLNDVRRAAGQLTQLVETTLLLLQQAFLAFTDEVTIAGGLPMGYGG